MFSVKFRYTQREFLPPPCRPRPRPRTDKAFVPSIDDKVVCVCVCVCVFICSIPLHPLSFVLILYRIVARKMKTTLLL
jgi:hypothetical protein